MASIFKSKKNKEEKIDKKTEEKSSVATKVVDNEVKPKKESVKAKKDTNVVSTPSRKSKNPNKTISSDLESVLLRPRITEKATDLQMNHNAYTFDVKTSSTKKEISQAVEDIYGVKAEKIKIVKIPSKKIVSRRGKMGTKPGGKKAYVFLKKGDNIEFV